MRRNGALEQPLGKFNADGTKAEEKKATAFSLFVKEHFGSVKERLPAGTPHKLVMQELSARWKSGGGTEKKTRAGDADAAGALEGMRAQTRMTRGGAVAGGAAPSRRDARRVRSYERLADKARRARGRVGSRILPVFVVCHYTTYT